MSVVDYSKWKDIEVSDDEDDTHPNIDTPSLFRWRHQARVERMEKAEEEKKEHETKKTILETLKDRLQAKKDSGEGVEELNDLIKKEEQRLKDEEEEMKKKERLTPWNVDTIAKDGFSKTIINKKDKQPDKELSETEKAESLQKFIKAHQPLLKKFGMMSKYEDSKKFLMENKHLACEETTNYLVIWCIDLAVEEKFELMDHVSHQTICMQFMLELAKQLDTDPRACISSFFSKISQIDQLEYKQAFEEELKLFRERIRKRALERIVEAEEAERLERLGPGGLDPQDVFETLPAALRECFESRDVSRLQGVIAEMDEKDATYHMKRCVDSGLWLPDKKSAEVKEKVEPTEEFDEKVENTDV